MVVDHLIQCILSLGARLALPGEFSKRAFLNGKIDLAQAEAIADLIHASSRQAAQLAIRSLQGAFSKIIQQICAQLIQIRIQVESAIDFPDDLADPTIPQRIATTLSAFCKQLDTIQQQAQQSCLIQEGATAIIIGPTNVGKSSLLNRLSGQDTAIVSDIAGTTRDILHDQMFIDGLPIHLLDTAGLRESHDIIEQEGMRRAQAAISQADIILYVVDTRQKKLPEETLNFLSAISQPILLVYNKIDLTQEPAGMITTPYPWQAVTLSAATGVGILELQQLIKTQLGYREYEGTFLARRRHLAALASAHRACQVAAEQLAGHHAIELAAENLRQAQLSLNEITGEFTSDDLLEHIFATFCIGK